MKIKAKIATYEDETLVFDLFIVKIIFTVPTITENPMKYKIKDSKKSQEIALFT